MKDRINETNCALEYQDMIIANKVIGDKFIKNAKSIIYIGADESPRAYARGVRWSVVIRGKNESNTNSYLKR